MQEFCNQKKDAIYGILRRGLFYTVKISARLSTSSLIFFPQVITNRVFMTNESHNYFFTCFFFPFFCVCVLALHIIAIPLSILANILHSYCCICSVFLLPLIYFSACTLPFGRYCGFLLFLFPFSLILRKSKNVFFFLFFFLHLHVMLA